MIKNASPILVFSIRNTVDCCSYRVHAGAKAEVGTLQLTTMVPVIEVVPTVLASSFLPSKYTRVCLVAHHNAFLKGGIVVLAGITAIHGDLHCVELVLCVLTRLVDVVGYTHVVVEKRHLK